MIIIWLKTFKIDLFIALQGQLVTLSLYVIGGAGALRIQVIQIDSQHGIHRQLARDGELTESCSILVLTLPKKIPQQFVLLHQSLVLLFDRLDALLTLVTDLPRADSILEQRVLLAGHEFAQELEVFLAFQLSPHGKKTNPSLIGLQ
jgi:hypothetical protein